MTALEVKLLKKIKSLRRTLRCSQDGLEMGQMYALGDICERSERIMRIQHIVDHAIASVDRTIAESRQAGSEAGGREVRGE